MDLPEGLLFVAPRCRGAGALYRSWGGLASFFCKKVNFYVKKALKTQDWLDCQELLG